MSFDKAMAALATAGQPQVAEMPSLVNTAPPLDLEGKSTEPKAKPTLQEAVKASEEPKKTVPPGADRFAALAKKERAIQQQSEQLKVREAKLSEFETIKRTATQNPLKALEILGVSYEQITEFILNGQKPTADLQVSSVKQEIEELRRERELEKEAAKKAQSDEYEKVQEQFRAEIGSFVANNAHQYELTALYKGEEIIQATIEQHYEATKKVLSIKEAADLVEQYFEDQVRTGHSKKFQAKQEPKTEGQPAKETERTKAPTLTNGLTSSAPSMLPAKTEADRINRALAALTK
jgi:hypothetical protein